MELNGGPSTVENVIGETIPDYKIDCKTYTVDMAEIQKKWEDRLEPIFPCNIKSDEKPAKIFTYTAKEAVQHASTFAKPKVLIPVVPGTNCEYDTAIVFERAGANPEIVVIKNLSTAALEESAAYFEKAVKQSQIIMIPGGFSGGDEPEGSGKFITAFLRGPETSEAVMDLLKNRDGLALGICNGFQALIKLGLVPYGEIRDTDETCPTLSFNCLGRHQSKIVNTRVVSNKSPWLARVNPGEVYAVPISHGEGRFLCRPELLHQLAENGQIATQYADLEGLPTMDPDFNPNGSAWAVEGITSPDGRVFGKMGHLERRGPFVGVNIPGNKHMPLFESGAEYFK